MAAQRWVSAAVSCKEKLGDGWQSFSDKEKFEAIFHEKQQMEQHKETKILEEGMWKGLRLCVCVCVCVRVKLCFI
jgi:phosphoribosylformimino-5-aminoimidazole carboxamide ribonucleotide (ProFAR) isomerase